MEKCIKRRRSKFSKGISKALDSKLGGYSRQFRRLTASVVYEMLATTISKFDL